MKPGFQNYLFAFLIILPFYCNSQQTVDLAHILDEWVLSDQRELVYENITVDVSSVRDFSGQYDTYLHFYRRMIDTYLLEKHGDKLMVDSGMVIIPKSVHFRNVVWPGDFELWNVSMISLEISNMETGLIDIRGSVVEELNLEGTKGTDVTLIGNETTNMNVGYFSQVRIQNHVFSGANFTLNDVLQVTGSLDKRMVTGVQRPFGQNKRIPIARHVTHFVDSARLKLFENDDNEFPVKWGSMGAQSLVHAYFDFYRFHLRMFRHLLYRNST